jgi:hypothetical protein
MVCSQSLSVVCKPGADVLILCGREDEIAISIVPGKGSECKLRAMIRGCAPDLGQSPLLDNLLGKTDISVAGEKPDLHVLAVGWASYLRRCILQVLDVFEGEQKLGTESSLYGVRAQSQNIQMCAGSGTVLQ